MRPVSVAPFRRYRCVALAMAVGLTASSAGCGQTPPGTPVSLLEYSAEVPASWEPREPSSGMRLAEYVAGTGADSVQVVVYYFGPGQGGSAQANIARWTSQFSAPGGGQVEPGVSTLEAAAFPTTLVALEGDYARTVGMGQPTADPLPDHRMEAAVVETPRGNLFIQMFGPRDAVADHSAEFTAFLRGIGSSEASGAD